MCRATAIVEKTGQGKVSLSELRWMNGWMDGWMDVRGK